MDTAGSSGDGEKLRYSYLGLSTSQIKLACSGEKFLFQTVKELRFHRKSRSISGEGFFCDGDDMHLTDSEPESYVRPVLEIRTWDIVEMKLLGPSPPPASLFSEKDFNTELQRSPSCKDCKVKKEEARNDREGWCRLKTI
ncbi:hypothetical protein Rs2_35436 [Raphanus sativus]|nr:hypothetical protein Rs2_35436 [Raphanus sativus]